MVNLVCRYIIFHFFYLQMGRQVGLMKIMIPSTYLSPSVPFCSLVECLYIRLLCLADYEFSIIYFWKSYLSKFSPIFSSYRDSSFKLAQQMALSFDYIAQDFRFYGPTYKYLSFLIVKRIYLLKIVLISLQLVT